MIRIGIDPGVTGAIACIGGELGGIALHDLPTSQRGKTGNKQQVNGVELARMLRDVATPTRIGTVHVYLELVKGMPRTAGGGSGMGATSAFNFGETFGVIRGVIETLGLPYTLVPPEVWKKRAGLKGAEKDASRTRALQLHPNIGHLLQRKKDIGRAEALLIAHFGPGDAVRDGALEDPFQLQGASHA